MLLFMDFAWFHDDGRVIRPKHVVVNIMNIIYLSNSVVSLRHCNGSNRTGNNTDFLCINFQAYLTSCGYIKLLYWTLANIFYINLVFFHHEMFSFTVDYTLYKRIKTRVASWILQRLITAFNKKQNNYHLHQRTMSRKNIGRFCLQVVPEGT